LSIRSSGIVIFSPLGGDQYIVPPGVVNLVPAEEGNESNTTSGNNLSSNGGS